MSDVWADKHKNYYATTDWIDKPSIFAETAIGYFPKNGRVLDLGAGQGQDSRFFAERGYEVVSTDLEQDALNLSKEKLLPELADKITLQKLDLREALPFTDGAFDVVYAHLSLHYFDAETTSRIFDEIYRVLKSGGVLAFFTNSTSDPEYGTGEAIEPDYYQIGQMAKRYLSVESARRFAHSFSELLADDSGETYKDSAKGIHNLIRFIGKKN
jgi:SAM-dependent methyltransferase